MRFSEYLLHGGGVAQGSVRPMSEARQAVLGRSLASYSGLPKYDRMVESLRECAAWAEAGFPGASLKQLIQIAQNTRLEEQAVAIRQRAERNFRKLAGVRQRRQPPSLLTRRGQLNLLSRGRAAEQEKHRWVPRTMKRKP